LVDKEIKGQAEHTNKKKAEQMAAQKALDSIPEYTTYLAAN
jgi:dsRNA-specific ribonuclease